MDLQCSCWGGENAPFLVFLSSLKIKLTRDRLTAENQVQFCTYRGLIGMRPKKHPKPTVFIVFKQRNNKFVQN